LNTAPPVELAVFSLKVLLRISVKLAGLV